MQTTDTRLFLKPEDEANALSRLPIPDQLIKVPMPQDVVLVLNHISESIISANHIKEWTDKDPVLFRLHNLVLTGGQISKDSNGLSPYTHCFSELSVADTFKISS